MGTVLVVGAGGSVAQAHSYRPVRSLRHPPLDGNFFDRCSALATTDSQLTQAIAALRQSIRAVPAIYDPWDRGSVTLEQFFADVYYNVANSVGSSSALSVFVALLLLYRRVLAETTNWIPRRGRLGDVDRLMRHELLESKDDLTVITFNHDLVLEHAALRLPRVGGQWCMRSLYGDVDLRPLTWAGEPFANHTAACVHHPPLRLLKLHGSTNWFVQSATRDPNLGTLFPPQRTERRVFVGNHGNVLNSARLRPQQRPGGRSWYLWPLIVPPIYDKQRISGMRLLQQVWDRATTAIEKADRLVFCGYSIPDADVLARQTLRTAVRQNERLQCVDCINPDASVAGKLHQTLDTPVIRLYANIDAYLTHS